ncbi:pyrroline-5-carboxylate reductase family protein [Pseudogemmobacter humi]|uniref:Pyrroline-5-carboxylate reductase n=1 Tax=Pseudogemmobacter humi TaxID=2483812 RepID=A0A3P5XFQ5_9RHOB|nr:pyrroline-5-carboxylate reductase dimerization domain-containing protein [Pseudogemmobacter humi]VDC33662.1 Pyrroline-5-carboxylate reductase [Pseudogemmobacter humi]
MKIGIIGATGWLGSALGRGLLDKGTAPGDLVLLNRSGPRADYHGRRVTWAADAAALAAQADVIVVSVRPGDWPALALHSPGRLVISFMAGVDCSGLAACGGRIVRAMPNAAAEIAASYSPWFAAPGVTDHDRQTVTRILSAIGTSDELTQEGQLDLMTALPGSGAAYPALMAEAMLAVARAHGLPEPVALRAVEAAVCGGARMLEGQVGRAGELLAAYHDYRGTTDAGLNAAEAAGFRDAIRLALEAATDKARAMARPPLA